jgi:hypothetical protein
MQTRVFSPWEYVLTAGFWNTTRSRTRFLMVDHDNSGKTPSADLTS